MTVYHHTVVDDVEREWEVDVAAAANVAAWAARAPEVLQADLAGMAEYFPHWMLVGCQASPRENNGVRLSRCPQCAVVLVPTEGGMRCVGCGEKGGAHGLLWLGHIPALARPEPSFQRRQQALREAGFAEITIGEATYLLVPLRVRYPAEWPNVEPPVRYAPRWLDALALPQGSGAHHLIQNGRACIFAWGHWMAMPIHTVLQQRMVNHIASLLKVAAGLRPREAFIGRIHQKPWRPASGGGNAGRR
jgi:hypothetical protein